MTTDSKTVRARVDHDICASAAACVQRAPQAFRLNAEGLSEFVPADPVDADTVQHAADACPMGAITVFGD